jgi:hypothetical protein
MGFLGKATAKSFDNIIFNEKSQMMNVTRKPTLARGKSLWLSSYIYVLFLQFLTPSSFLPLERGRMPCGRMAAAEWLRQMVEAQRVGLSWAFAQRLWVRWVKAVWVVVRGMGRLPQSPWRAPSQ